MKTKQTYGVQDWSAGDIYPAVIAVDSRFTADGKEDFRSYTILLDGREFPGYATHEDAEKAAPAIVAAVRGRTAVNPHQSGMAPASAFDRILK